MWNILKGNFINNYCLIKINFLDKINMIILHLNKLSILLNIFYININPCNIFKDSLISKNYQENNNFRSTKYNYFKKVHYNLNMIYHKQYIYFLDYLKNIIMSIAKHKNHLLRIIPLRKISINNYLNQRMQDT
jgi:hypothetical protein